MSVTTKANIIQVPITTEMPQKFLSYAAYVVKDRAIPNADDGLKKVQRRILISQLNMGLTPDRPHKKTVGIVGEAMGKYHPHGDASIYQALVRMAQPWSMRYPLIDSQGNFGSIDGDPPAAMRYTEARIDRIANEGLLQDLSKDTVDYTPTFDNAMEEPSVLPSKMPNLLLNGATGIAVGMATNMAPHNLREVTDAICATIDNPEITVEELLQDHIQGPDFPTAGIIYGHEGIKNAFTTGKGSIVIRGKADIEIQKNGRERILITELPYTVNKANLIIKIAKLVNEKVIEGIVDIRDETNREGMRVVCELKRSGNPNVILNNLYKHTELQSTFSINNVALVGGEPKLLNIKQLIENHIRHRYEVITKRSQAELQKVKYQAHILEGYLHVIEKVDSVIKIIKASPDSVAAIANLIKAYKLSQEQAKAILDMRLKKLTGLEIEKIKKQHQECQERIQYLEELLASGQKRKELIKEELHYLKKKFGDPRRTEIVANTGEIGIEDIIPNIPMVITLTHRGYIKATPLANYKAQHRGGIGSKSVKTKSEDTLTHCFVANAHNYLLIFTQYGKIFWKKVYELPQGSKQAQGRAIQNVIELEGGDQVCSILKVARLRDKDYNHDKFVTFCTRNGTIKKCPLEAFSRPMKRGIRAITFREEDRLISVQLTYPDHHIILGSKTGSAIRFHHTQVNPTGRTAIGVRGIRLQSKKQKDANEAIGMISTPENDDTTILVVSEKKFGKRSYIRDYKIQKRGGMGVKTMKITNKTGKLVAIKAVRASDDIIIMKASGTAVRIHAKSVRIISRVTQGCRVLRDSKKGETDPIAYVEVIKDFESEKKEKPSLFE